MTRPFVVLVVSSPEGLAAFSRRRSLRTGKERRYSSHCRPEGAVETLPGEREMSYTSLFYHIVFSTKERRAFLKPELLERVCNYMGGVARDMEGQLVAANGAADHVHLAAIVHQTVTVADFVKEVKMGGSRWIHETFPRLRDFQWQEGYAAFTVSKSIVPQVVKYVRGQKAHHQKATFQEELIALLERHGVEYDERYLWR